MAKSLQIVIGIPGRWPDRADIITSIAERSGGYLFAGMFMVKIGSKDSCRVEIYERDPNLKNAFVLAGRERLTENDLENIEQHNFTLYLVADGGSFDSAKKLLHAANAILKAGGIAVKVESAGTAHSASQWAAFCNCDFSEMILLQAFVTYIRGEGIYYSCGMHNLGLQDAIVEADIDPDEAAELLFTFLGYLLIENPTVNDGETFSVNADAPRYRLFREPCTCYVPDDLFYNPFGMWKLTPV